jgi:hypothetical protein
MRFLVGIVAACVLLVEQATAFVPKNTPVVRSPTTTTTTTTSRRTVAIAPPEYEGDVDPRSFHLSRAEIKPLIVLGKGEKEKVVNAFGLWCFVCSVITGPIWMLSMKLVHQMGKKDENRAMYDRTGKIWSKTFLTLTDSYPTVSGNTKWLKEGNDLGACLFVANHASWLDIPVLCTVLDPVFKFISKAELSKVPCIGTQLSGVSDCVKVEGRYYTVGTSLEKDFVVLTSHSPNILTG